MGLGSTGSWKMQYQHQGGYQGQSPYRDGTNQGAPQQSGYQASTQGQMAGQMAQSHSNQAGMMSSPQQRPASMNQPQPMSQQGMYGSQGGGQRRGNDQEAQITDLMHQVESKRSELENMTLSVVQWKQTFKDKLQHEKLEIQRDAERAISSRAQGRDLLLERTSLRMLNLYGKIGLAVAFQNLRQHRKQVLWLQRVKELKTQCEALREEATIAVRPPPRAPPSSHLLRHAIQPAWHQGPAVPRASPLPRRPCNPTGHRPRDPPPAPSASQTNAHRPYGALLGTWGPGSQPLGPPPLWTPPSPTLCSLATVRGEQRGAESIGMAGSCSCCLESLR